MPDGPFDDQLAAQIAADLDHFGRCFDLTAGELGERAGRAMARGVVDSFDHETDPNGRPWDDLSPGYERWKARHFPGKPINVRTGLLRSELEGDDLVDVEGPDGVSYAPGRTDQGRKELEWAEEGDPTGNRPERRIVGLTPESIQELDRIFDAEWLGDL